MNDWIEAEDSFLSLFSDKTIVNNLYIYKWKEGPWSKFNFIRPIRSNRSIDFDQVKKLILKNKEEGVNTHFKSSVDRSFENKDIVLKRVGTPIAHCSNLSSDFIIEDNPECELVEVKTNDEFRDWWIVNSDGRSRENPFESIIYNKLKTIKIGLKHRFFMLKYDNQFVTSLAITKTSSGYNCWGLATLDKHQRKGFAKSIYSKVSRLLKKDVIFYAQNNLNSSFSIYRRNKPNFREYIIEACYEVE